MRWHVTFVSSSYGLWRMEDCKSNFLKRILVPAVFFLHWLIGTAPKHWRTADDGVGALQSRVYHSISGTKRQKDARTVSRNVYIVCFGDSGSVYSWKWDVKLPNYPVGDTEFITWTRAEPNPIDFQGLWPVNCFREVLSRPEKEGKAGVAARCDAWKVKRASELHRMTTQAIIVWQNLRPLYSNIQLSMVFQIANLNWLVSHAIRIASWGTALASESF